jgi:hypothetical protein
LEQRYLLACPDDLCRRGSTTLCGLEHGYDFDVDESEDDYYGQDGYADLGPLGPESDG